MQGTGWLTKLRVKQTVTKTAACEADQGGSSSCILWIYAVRVSRKMPLKNGVDVRSACTEWPFISRCESPFTVLDGCLKPKP